MDEEAEVVEVLRRRDYGREPRVRGEVAEVRLDESTQDADGVRRLQVEAAS